MKLKLIDVRLDEDFHAKFGTCDLCMSTGYAAQPTYIFEDENGIRTEVEGYYWSWGDYDEINVNNVIDFAAWVAEQDFSDTLKEVEVRWDTYNQHSIFDGGWLRAIVQAYNEKLNIVEGVITYD